MTKAKDIKILDREKIESILDKLNEREVIEMAYTNYCPDHYSGLTVLNLETGELEEVAVYKDEEVKASSQAFITIYSIDYKRTVTLEDICESLSIWDYPEEVTDEIVVDFLQQEFWGQFDFGDIYDQLDDWYKNIKEDK